MQKIKRLVRSGVLSGFLQSRSSDIRKVSIVFFRHDADCGYRFHGRVYSQVIDSLADIASSLGITHLSVAAPYSHLHGEFAHNSPLVFNRTFLRVALVFEFLKRVLGYERAYAYKRAASIKAWRKILGQIRPKVIIGIQPNRYLCAAAKADGIPVYDYQHGVIAPDHWWYGKMLPNEIPDAELPTGIICWDRNSAEALDFWASRRKVQVRIMGNPWFKRFEDAEPHDELVQAELRAGTCFDNDRPTILVSLQWGLAELYYEDTEFNNVMCDDLASVIRTTHQQYNWMLRLHPVQLHGFAGRETLAYLEREFGMLPGVDWSWSSRLPLPVVLRNARLHITDMSTVVTEAAWYGVPSAILNPHVKPGGRLQTLFRREREAGIASLVGQSEQCIKEWIENSLKTSSNRQRVAPNENPAEFLKEAVSIDGTINHTNH